MSDLAGMASQLAGMADGLRAATGPDGEDVNVCRDCGRRWTALEEAHCAACHRHFSSDSAFDRHQAIDHRPCARRPENQGDNPHKMCAARSVCRDPVSLRKADGSPRLVEVAGEFGPVWAHPGTRPSFPDRSNP